jgi:hypothetical protein
MILEVPNQVTPWTAGASKSHGARLYGLGVAL